MDSQRPSEPWKSGDELEAVRLEQMRHNAESAQLTSISPNVHLYRGAQGGTALAVDDAPPGGPSELVTVILAGGEENNHPRGGCYLGHIGQMTLAGIGYFDETDDGELHTAVYVVPAGEAAEEVTIINMNEQGNPGTWYLTDPANTYQKTFNGRIVAGLLDSEGRRCVVINGFYARVCTPPEE